MAEIATVCGFCETSVLESDTHWCWICATNPRVICESCYELGAGRATTLSAPTGNRYLSPE